MMLTSLSVCSGIEAWTVATAGLGYHHVGYAEIDQFASEVLAHRYGSNMPGEPLSRNAPPNFGDFTQIPLETLGRVDILVGGTPCQAFSIAGKRQSLADARGNLTLSYVVLAHELARSHGLRNAIWENVPGVLSTADNAFGCFLGALVGSDAPCVSPLERGRWPDVGMVAGPAGRAAWRVLDAQCFGLAQRRRRVFVVADFGNGADPAAVLFERQGLRGHPPSRGKAGEGAAAEAAQGAGIRSAFGGGGRTSGPIDQAACLTANGGGQAMDFEVETFVVETAPTLRAGGNATGGDRPYGMDVDTCDSLIAHALRGEGFDASEDGTGRGTPIVPVVFSIMPQNSGKDFKARQVDVAQPLMAGGPVGGNQGGDYILQPVCFSCKDHGADAGDDVAPTMRAMGHGDSHANGGGQLAVAFAIQERAVSENPDAGPDGIGVREGLAYTLEARGSVQAVAFVQNSRDEVRLFGDDGQTVGALAGNPGAKQQCYLAEPYTLMERGRAGESNFEYRQDGTANAILTPNGGRGGFGVGAIAHEWAVRRLTPLECERLQSFPDGYTAIQRGNKSADQCPDGPRYKALGNSMAVPVMRWIAQRLEANMQRVRP